MHTNEKEKVAMFRYGVIAALVCRRMESKADESIVRREILGKEWVFPDGSMRKVPERTLREWLVRYRRYGLDGLYDGLRKERSNKGRFRAIPVDTLNRAEQLRRELPDRSSQTIMELLKLEGIETNGFSERTLQRHLKRLNALRSRSSKVLHQRWEQLYTNDLWHGDTAHAVWLPDPTNPNKMKRTKLIAFVDDASRICTHGEFYFDERLPNLIDTFSKALMKRGKPRRLLLDNAFIFHSTALEVMCAELETELSFCRPRRPQGKGKIERLIRTIKDSFVSEANRAGFTSLEELNQSFAGWLENYHNRVHSEIKQTPHERWQKDEAKLTAVTPEHIRRALMMRTKRRVQAETGTVYLDGLEYTCSKDVAGETVEVRWHVDFVDSVEVWLDGRFVETARLSERPTTLPKFDVAAEEESYPTIESAKDRMEQLRMVTGVQQMGPRSDEFVSVDGFIKLMARYLERAFSQPELERLAAFFKSTAPLRKASIEEALNKTISVKGSRLHLRYYLEYLQTAVRGK